MYLYLCQVGALPLPLPDRVLSDRGRGAAHHVGQDWQESKVESASALAPPPVLVLASHPVPALAPAQATAPVHNTDIA